MSNETPKPAKYDIFHQLINGAIGGSLNAISGHPFDTIRVRMQSVDSSYGSSLECLKTTIKTEGYGALFNGIKPSIMSMVAETSIVFLTNDIIKRKLLHSDINTSTIFYQDALIGSASGFVGTIVSCPYETLKCSMQVTHSTPLSVIKLSKHVGFRGLFSGFGATCSRNILFYLGFFPLYSRSLDVLNNTSCSNIIKCSIAGGVSGVIAWSIIYPSDVIKSNQQIYHNNISVYKTARDIIKTRGIKGMYAGLLPTLIRAFTANSALMAGIEMSNIVLKN